MSKYRQAARVDDNQGEIVTALNKIPGVKVEAGHDDLLVGCRGKTFWYEVKNPEAKLKRKDGWRKGAIKKSQQKLEKDWTGHYKIVSSLDEILSDMGLTTQG